MPVASDPKLAFALRRPFAEQVAFFRGKLGNLVPTAKWHDLWKSQHDRAFMVAGAAKADLLADLAGAVDAAKAQGETIQQFRKRFKQIVTDRGWHGWTGEGTKAGEAWRTRVIYETNLLTSYSAGRLAQLKAAGYRYWMYKHSDSVRHPRPHHQALNGVVRPADDAFWQTHYPPNGWNCFPGDTLVRADARLGQRLFYRGKMVELRTASGKRLALTINHPVLTGRGWVAAGEVQAGDKMIQAGVDINASLIGIVHNPQPPARADNLFETLAAQGFRVIPIAADDFHGDAGCGDGEVHIAGADGVLVDVIHAALGHGGSEFCFDGALAGGVESADDTGGAANQATIIGDAVLSQNSADGGFGQAETASNGGLADVASPVHRNNLALDVVVSRIGNRPGGGHQAILPVAGGLFSLPSGAHAVAPIADGDVVLAQDSGEGAAGMPGLFGKLLEANAGLVATDEVVDVRQYDWAGHVYDFSTKTGLIVAGGLVVSNCRCRVVGVDGPRSAARLGGDMNKPLPQGWDAINPKTGEPVGIDKGWGYMPGGTVVDAINQLAGKLLRLPAEVGACLGKDLPLDKIADEFGGFFDQALANRARPEGKWMVVGAMKPEWVARMKTAGVMPSTAEIAIRDRDIAHAFRDAKGHKLPAAWFRDLPRHLRNPQAVILDETHKEGPALLLIYDAPGDAKKLVVRVNYQVKKAGEMNIVETGQTVDMEGVASGIGKGYTLLEGGL